ncbi:hypothetical protein [Runella salmonicolor]|uniref:Uncharacterized protein n=1 Tax=Runella salmonicolor TaxID=2950278 RepID=A0ABT1FVA5_9BACT|nr:hypothetical protein [Runella salmonicolor]MCP1384603.1 hypothetical protein [Runella salmonicolor]
MFKLEITGLKELEKQIKQLKKDLTTVEGMEKQIKKLFPFAKVKVTENSKGEISVEGLTQQQLEKVFQI